jgi:hypothetical protein
MSSLPVFDQLLADAPLLESLECELEKLGNEFAGKMAALFEFNKNLPEGREKPHEQIDEELKNCKEEFFGIYWRTINGMWKHASVFRKEKLQKALKAEINVIVQSAGRWY